MIKIETQNNVGNNCSGNVGGIPGKITQIIDEDTIKVYGKSIRFALASSPELDEVGGAQAKNFIEHICPVNSTVLVDEDDMQTQGSYGRRIGVVYCNGVNLNEELVQSGHGEIASKYCSNNEFAKENWAQKYGCTTHKKISVPEHSTIMEPTQDNCDPSYPNVCTAPYPPDLDCGEITFKNFRVLPPDPHGFDRDNDWIGCES